MKIYRIMQKVAEDSQLLVQVVFHRDVALKRIIQLNNRDKTNTFFIEEIEFNIYFRRNK
jgi:hypothetical protein